MKKLLLVLLMLFIPIVAYSQVSSIDLDWTATGDDGNIGTATRYEMRWSPNKPDTTSATLFQAWWDTAVVVAGLPVPTNNGTPQSVTVTRTFATGKTYYFVIRAYDDVGNASGFSNVAFKFIPDTIPPALIITLKCR